MALRAAQSPIYWRLVFIILYLYVNCLAQIYINFQSAPTYQRSTNLFCFFAWANPNALWTNWVGFASSLT
jgi:hypothetical protein